MLPVVLAVASLVPALPGGWDLRHTLAHGGAVAAVAFGPGDALATGDTSGRLVVWDAKAGKQVHTLADGTKTGKPVDRARFTPDGKRLHAVTGDGGAVHLWAARADGWVHADTAADPRGTWNVLGATPSGDHLLYTFGGRTAILFRNQLGIQAASAPVEARFPHPADIDHAACGDDSVVTVAAGVLRRWGRADGGLAWDPRPAWQVTLMRIDPLRVAVGPGGKVVAVAGEGGEVRLFSGKTGNVVGRLAGHKGPVYAVAFSPDGARVVTGGEDRTVRVWDAGKCNGVAVLVGHTDAVTDAAFAPDGKTIAAGGTDGTVRVWVRGE